MGRDLAHYRNSIKLWDDARSDLKLIGGDPTEITSIELTRLKQDYPRVEWDDISSAWDKTAPKKKPVQKPTDIEMVDLGGLEEKMSEVPMSKTLKVEDLPPSLSDPLKEFMKKYPDDIEFGLDGKFVLDMEKFKGFAKGFVKGLGAGIAIGVATDELLDTVAKYTKLDKDGQQYLELGVNMAIATGVILADPESPWGWVYLASTPVSMFVDWLKGPEKRARLNDSPEDIWGSNFGKVRAIDPKDGTVKWFPAIYSSKEVRPRGDDVNIRMTYGNAEDLMWKANPDGTFKLGMYIDHFHLGGATTPHPKSWGVVLPPTTPQFGGYSLFFPGLATTPDYPPFWGVVPQIMRFHNYTTKSLKSYVHKNNPLGPAAGCCMFCGVGAPFTTFLLCFESCFWLHFYKGNHH